MDKSCEQKILDYLSKPRQGKWVKAKTLSQYFQEPLERVEFYICFLTDVGLIEGYRDTETGEYFVIHPWIKS